MGLAVHGVSFCMFNGLLCMHTNPSLLFTDMHFHNLRASRAFPLACLFLLPRPLPAPTLQVRMKGAVQSVRAPEAQGYGGEATGIKARVAKSRKLG